MDKLSLKLYHIPPKTTKRNFTCNFAWKNCVLNAAKDPLLDGHHPGFFGFSHNGDHSTGKQKPDRRNVRPHISSTKVFLIFCFLFSYLQIILTNYSRRRRVRPLPAKDKRADPFGITQGRPERSRMGDPSIALRVALSEAEWARN